MGYLATFARQVLSRRCRDFGTSFSREQLFRDQVRIAGRAARTIFDVGAQHGQNALQYYRDFPTAQIFAFEPAPDNLARIQSEIAGKERRIEAIGAAIGETAGEMELNLNSHDGTHSRLPIGDLRYWSEPVAPIGKVGVPAIGIDAFMRERGLSDVDVLAMDIQGGELPALRGARSALEEGRIGLIVLEVAFKPIYQGIPLFWEIGAFLARFDFNLFGLYDGYHASSNDKVLVWGDALFVGPRHQKLGQPG